MRDAALIEAAERATLAALSPSAMDELDGWLIPYEQSVVNRTKSAVPLRHAQVAPALLDEISARYRARGMQPRFRIADVPAHAALQEALSERGLQPVSPTRVELGTLAALTALARADAPAARVLARPDDRWREAFIAAGDHTQEEERSRLSVIERSRDSLFAELREGEHILSMGMAHVGFQLLSLHGIRTLPAARGRGLAGQLLAAVSGAGRARGAERCLLQVEENNHAARALYARAGFSLAWTYRYWIER